MRKRLSNTQLTKIAIVTFALFAAFNNCSEGWKAVEYTQVSLGCGQSKVVSNEELHQLVGDAHDLSKGDRIRCPGFFAVIDEGSANSLAAQKKSQVITDNCGEDGTPGPPLPEDSVSKDELIEDLIARTDASNIRAWVEAMSDNSLWPTRYHRSTYNNDVSDWIVQEFTKIANGRAGIRIRRVTHRNTPQDSVEVIIPGTGANKDQYVVLGGHQDSIHSQNSGSNPEARSPGADDNASGVAALLETFRVLMEADYQPDATIAIYTYAAEEVGLVGSQEVAQSYANASREVLGVMQLDMAMYSATPSNNIKFITDYTSSNLTNLAANLSEQFLGMSVSYMTCGYACSDHASWTNYGYPSFMPAEDQVDASINRIHSLADVVDAKMSEDYASTFAKLALAFTVSLGSNE